MSARALFDLRRISTAVSSTGRVHITQFGGAETLCGLDLLKRDRVLWQENLDDRQPDCLRCIEEAHQRPATHPCTSVDATP